jgi:S1-C subfamily serine protease
MLKKLLVCLLVLLSGCSFTFNAAPPKTPSVAVFDPDSTFKSVARVSVELKIGVLYGTAFAISPDLLMTAGHVCSSFIAAKDNNLLVDGMSLDYYGPNGETIISSLGVDVVEVNEENDVCILKKNDHGLVPVRIVKDYNKVGPKDVVHIVGAPMGIYITHYDGEIIGKNMTINKDMPPRLVVSAASAPGNSGGPVFNDKGEVVGMLIAGVANFEHLSICTPSSVLIKFFNVFVGK